MVTKYYHIPTIHVEDYIIKDSKLSQMMVNYKINWDKNTYGSEWQSLWNARVHPPWPYHQLLSNLLAYVWYYQNDHICDHVTDNEDIHKHNKHIPHHHDLPPLMPELKEYATVMNEFCLHPTHNINTNDIVDIPFYKEVGTNKSSPRWNLGEDVIGNGKPGWWLDNPKGGMITFKVRLRDINPIIGVGYLQSYEKMGKVRIYIDDNKADSVYIDALDTSQHVSVLGYQRLCQQNITSITSTDDGSNNNNNNTYNHHHININAKKRGKKTKLLETLLHFPSCQASIPASHRYRSNQFDEENESGIFHDLNFELLPNVTSKHNKFKIIYIVTC